MYAITAGARDTQQGVKTCAAGESRRRSLRQLPGLLQSGDFRRQFEAAMQGGKAQNSGFAAGGPVLPGVGVQAGGSPKLHRDSGSAEPSRCPARWSCIGKAQKETVPTVCV